MEQKTALATFGAGCFWGVEETFRKLPGVVNTTVGYMGGTTENPTYEQVCTDTTDHAEVVHIEYNPRDIDFQKLLEVFFNSHDPTQLDRQGPDVGRQYRSVIFYYTDEQKKVAETTIDALTMAKTYPKSIATELVEAGTFYKAEEYHQRYLQKRGLGTCHV